MIFAAGGGAIPLVDPVAVFSTAVATLGFVALAVFSMLSSTSRARSFALLCGGLALWSFLVLLQWVVPGSIPRALRWSAAVLLPELSRGFVATQWPATWCARAGVRRAFRMLVVLSWLVLIVAGDPGVNWCMPFVYGGLLAVSTALLRSSRGGRPLFWMAVSAGLTCVSALYDQLVLAGKVAKPFLGSLTPLALLWFVAVLGATVARQRVEELRAVGGRAIAVAAITGALAVGVVHTLEPLQGSLAALPWVWFVLLAFALVQRPLWRFLESPFQRERMRVRQRLLETWRRVDVRLAEIGSSERLIPSVLGWLAQDEAVESADLRDVHPGVDEGGLRAPVEVGAESFGVLELQLCRSDLDADAELRRELRALGRRVATTLAVLRLREAEGRREQLARLGLMATGIAHEIQGPLGSIRGAADLIEDDAATPAAKRWLGVVRQEVDRMREFVTEVLTYGRMPEPTLRTAPLAELCEQLELALGPRARAAEIRLQLDFASECWTADFGQLRHLLHNLAANAIQALEESGATNGLVLVRARTVDGRLVILIADNGPGIEQSARDSLFEPFFSTRAKGTGLGLAVARLVAEAHGGTLRCVDPGVPLRSGLEDAVSASLGGARFLLELPPPNPDDASDELPRSE